MLLCFSLVVCCTPVTMAQEGIPDRKGKLFMVPELWLSFGTLTYVEVAPLLGYHLSDRISVGAGPHYLYQARKATPYYPYSYKTHAYGLKGFVRFALITNAEQFLPFRLFSDLFAHLEYEGLSLEKEHFYTLPGNEEGRFLYHGVLVGGGINQRVGMFNSISIMALWNLNGSSNSPYSNPVFRVGFNLYF